MQHNNSENRLNHCAHRTDFLLNEQIQPVLNHGSQQQNKSETLNNITIYKHKKLLANETTLTNQLNFH
jgi:hypothetical protein